MKALLTSGCSFSDIKYTKTWPHWLEQHMNTTVAKHTGSSNHGNDLIAKKTITFQRPMYTYTYYSNI